MKNIILKSIGRIKTDFSTTKGIVIQGRFDRKAIGRVRLLKRYRAGLKDIEGFSHLILIYILDQTKTHKLIVKPFLEDIPHGVFATRSPFRPNPIGFTVVRIKKIHKDGFTFIGVDMLDNTPLLDIKPYISYVDVYAKVRNGWFSKHLRGGRIPVRARISKDIMRSKFNR
jgi:tRNA-Thr(GGU) m(6)t(6)A37 methyltransferase TsaA